MTTIAANKNRMVADSFVAFSDHSSYTTEKLERIGDSIVGCAGPSEWCREFLEWRHGRAKKPSFGDTGRFEALLLNRTGLYMFENDCIPNRVLEGKAAIGSGRKSALAILYFGGTPQQAVEIACRIDPNSKLPMMVLRLD